VSPLRLFRAVAVTEAITWLGLLAGMLVKYVPEAPFEGEVGVQVFGPLHGIAFVAYCVATVAVAVDQRWSAGRTALGLVSAVPPLMTVWFDRHVERRDGLDLRWRLRSSEPRTLAERVVGFGVRRPGTGLAVGVAAVGLLTATALVVGPPVG